MIGSTSFLFDIGAQQNQCEHYAQFPSSLQPAIFLYYVIMPLQKSSHQIQSKKQGIELVPNSLYIICRVTIWNK